MTKVKLAELLFPYENHHLTDSVADGKRAAFINGLDHGPEFMRWWWCLTIEKNFDSVEEAFELFLTEKYGSNG